MRRLGFFVISLLIGSFLSSSLAYAEITAQDLAKAKAYTSIFAGYGYNFGPRWEGMAQSVFDKFKDDPDVDYNQYIKYVLNGIPGATIPNQTGYIPMLNGIISGNASSDLVSKAQLALSNANQILSRTNTREQLAGGSITQEQADQQLRNAAAADAQQSAKVLDQRAADDAPCSMNPLKFDLTKCIDQGVAWFLRNTFLAIAGVLMKLSASILNLAVSQGILNFKNWAPDTLYNAWLVVRQIISLVVVFAGLYLGFMYIIGREDAFTKYIGWLVIFALFVNFSYPITRMLTDVSNVVSLNIYSSILGPEALVPNSNTSAGTLLMTKLGLQKDIESVNVKADATPKLDSLSSTPNVLLLIVFTLYAAYVFFMTAGILIIRTLALVMLTIVSPILLIDSVIPKLGDAAVKLRKIYFEQLIVAPVFMILFALTMKFMDAFPRDADQSTAHVFFNLLMMIIMLHIMFKITKEVGGKLGEAATNAMGKVGGFGLAAATMGTGMLARGTVGAAAGRLRDSAWMDKLQGSSMGRGLYGLSNSLAQSTYDPRNISMVSRGLASAGITGGMGLSMQQGLKQSADQRFAAREAAVLKKGQSIRDDDARGAYFKRANVLSPIRPIKQETLREADRAVTDKRQTALAAFAKADSKERQVLMDRAKDDDVLQKKMRTVNDYLAKDPSRVSEKVDELMKLNNPDEAKRVIENDPFTDIQETYRKDIEKRESELDSKSKVKKMVIDGVEQSMSEYEYHRQQIALKKKEMKDEIEAKRKEILEAYKDRNNEITRGPLDVNLDEPYVAPPLDVDLNEPYQTEQRTSNVRREGNKVIGSLDTTELDKAGLVSKVSREGNKVTGSLDTSELDSAGFSQGSNTYPVTNTIQPIEGGRFVYAGQVFQSITEAAAAKAQDTRTASGNTGPTPAPKPMPTGPTPAPTPRASGPAPAPRPLEPAEAVA